VGETLINTTQGLDGGIVVEIRGEIDIASADRLRQVLVDTVSRLRPVRLVVDLLHVTFIDSVGLGALVAGHQAAHALGVRCTIRQPSPFVLTQLHQTGLYDTLTADR
jgi:anti-sigma B factor antagonist